MNRNREWQGAIDAMEYKFPNRPFCETRALPDWFIYESRTAIAGWLYGVHTRPSRSSTLFRLAIYSDQAVAAGPTDGDEELVASHFVTITLNRERDRIWGGVRYIIEPNDPESVRLLEAETAKREREKGQTNG